MNRTIVSRHEAAIQFIRREAPEFLDAPVVAQATAEDVTGRVVAGNLPLHLAALAAEVVAVEFSGLPPRGQEYDLSAMDAAGACLRRYRVTAVPTVTPAPTVPLADDVEVERFTSTNGRWGLSVIAQPRIAVDAARVFSDQRQFVPLPGLSVTRVGWADGFTIVRLNHQPGTIALFAECEMEVVRGDALLVSTIDLQSGRYVTCLAARPGALIRRYGYMRRGSTLSVVGDDGLVAAPPHLALAE